VNVAGLTIADAAEQIRKKSLSPVELVETLLRRIDTFDPRLNAYLVVTGDEARRAARQAAEEIGRGDYRGPLHGIPLALKDLFDTRGVRTTAGAKIFADRVPERDAYVVEKLRDAGAILLGKLNMHEWALGVTTANPHFGPTRNPWDTQRIPGGSSGGSGAAVAATLCLGALGSDTGGSIRIPASLCGIVGLKPTYGRVSLRGVIPLSWSLDHAGPMTKTVRDAALLLQVIAGYDGDDPVSVNIPVDDYCGDLERGVRGLRVAVPRNFFFEVAHAEVAEVVRAALRVLEQLGALVEEITLPGVEEAHQANVTITLSDAAAYHRAHLETRPDDIGADVLARLQRGAEMTSSAYALARRAQAEWRRKFERLLGEYAVLAVPTTPIAAVPIEGTDAVKAARVLTSFTGPFNLPGLPAISVPCGFTHAGLPVGLQLVARPWAEATVLSVAHAYEQATEWHKRCPTL